MNKIEFGYCLPIFANPGMFFFRTPNYKRIGWFDLKKSILLAEKLGYDSLFVADHLFLGNKGEIWECLSLISNIAGFTKKIKIAPIHLCDTFRNPALTAKSICTISHVSNNRFFNFYDYGWRQDEFNQYGYSFLSDSKRIEKMDEGITIINGMLKNERFTFKGKYYQVENAICNPKPLGKIPLWMGEANHPAMIKSIVKHADVFNSMPISAEGLENKLEIIKSECILQKRNFINIGKSLETQILIIDSEKEKNKYFKKIEKLLKYNDSKDDDIVQQLINVNPSLKEISDLSVFEKDFIIGTPDYIIKRIDEYIDLGISHFMLWFMDYPDSKNMKFFASNILPRYKK